MKNWLGGALVGGLLIAMGAGGTYYFLTKNRTVEEPKPIVEVTPTPAASKEPVVVEEEEVPEEEEEESSVPEGWLAYESTNYGFVISYPDSYEALDDANNLYGWENGIVLLYSGGQSYDIAVEAWDTVAEYESKYPGGNYVVLQVGGQYLTAVNLNMTPVGGEILASFGLLN